MSKPFQYVQKIVSLNFKRVKTCSKEVVMRKSIFIFLINLFIANSSLGQDQLENRETYLRKEADAFMKQYKIPGLAMIVYIDGESYVLPFGYADKKQKKWVARDTLFELGSISKIFTCILLCNEIIQQHMALQDSINVHIPALQDCRRLKHITFAKLCTHTSSLPFNAPAQVKSERDLIRYIAAWRPQRNGHMRQYSNHGIELIRIALEEKTKNNYNELLINTILNPLGMTPIGVIVPENLIELYAACYDKLGEETGHWDHPFLIGSAAIKASSFDMLNFLKAMLGVIHMPDTLMQAIKMTQLPYVSFDSFKHGLGWHMSILSGEKIGTREIEQSDLGEDDRIICEKTGTTHGFHAYIGVMPRKKSGIVILFNRRLHNGWSISKRFGRKLLKKAIKIPTVLFSPLKPDSSSQITMTFNF